MILRDYQQKLETDIYAAWQDYQNVLTTLSTGGGKTAIFSSILQAHIGASCAIAHRQELVSQISLALAEYGVRHRIIGPKKVIQWIVQLQVEEFGQSFYDANAPCAVAGVDTLLRRKIELAPWLQQVTLWVTDEAHHITRANKWGKAVALFPNAKGLGVTATPCRADGKGLGRHADGVMDVLVEGPPMRELITRGYLSDYRIFAPPSDFNMGAEKVGKSGDWSYPQLKQQAKKSCIVGDVVTHYLKFAAGKQGITFASDVETATEMALKFRAAGVAAEMVSSKTPDKLRIEVHRRFKNKQTQQLVNVDIYGEGVDIPAVEVVSFARPTESYGVYIQQFGRALRPLPNKPHALIIDHVGNVIRHGLPDAKREWTLDRRVSRKAKDQDGIIPVRICVACTAIFEAIYKQCPYCGHMNEPASRAKPEFIDGDLTELEPAVLAAMRGEIERIDAPEDILRNKMEHAGAPALVVAGACKNHRLRQEAQVLLRESMAWWAGHQTGSKSEICRRFYFTFGIDGMTAKALGRREAEALAVRVARNIDTLVNGR